MLTCTAVFSALLCVHKAHGYHCEGGHYCANAEECCKGGCCYSYPLQRPTTAPYRHFNILLYNHWYFWCIVAGVSCLAGACWWLYRARARLCPPCRRGSDDSLRRSTGSFYLPPQYSRCNSFIRPPPPYNEVTSKPNLYPLVISYGESDKGGGSYLMVHYLRNYILRPGTLSATSTAESLNSSLLCNATEANSLIPPPYTADNLSEWHLDKNGAGSHRPIPRSVSTMTYSHGNPRPDRTSQQFTLSPDSSPDQRDVRSVIRTTSFNCTSWDGEASTLQANRQEASTLQANRQEASTGSQEEVTTWAQLYEKMFSEDRRNAREGPSNQSDLESLFPQENEVKTGKSRRKSSLFVPLNDRGKGATMDMSRMPFSAPTTPCGGFVPTLMTLSQRMSGSIFGSKSSRLTREESDPLLEKEESTAAPSDPNERSDESFF